MCIGPSGSDVEAHSVVLALDSDVERVDAVAIAEAALGDQRRPAQFSLVIRGPICHSGFHKRPHQRFLLQDTTSSSSCAFNASRSDGGGPFELMKCAFGQKLGTGLPSPC